MDFHTVFERVFVGIGLPVLACAIIFGVWKAPRVAIMAGVALLFGSALMWGDVGSWAAMGKSIAAGAAGLFK